MRLHVPPLAASCPTPRQKVRAATRVRQDGIGPTHLIPLPLRSVTRSTQLLPYTRLFWGVGRNPTYSARELVGGVDANPLRLS